MNKRVYIKELEKHLRQLPDSERLDVLNYYEEIFEDRGIDEGDQVPSDMPSSQSAAEEILLELGYDPVTNKRDPLIKIVLTILAAPMAIPLAFTAILLIFAFAVALIAVFIGFFGASLSGLVIGVFNLCHVTTLTLPSALFNLGLILFTVAILILLAKIVIDLGKSLIQSVKLVYKKVRRNKNEKKDRVN